MIVIYNHFIDFEKRKIAVILQYVLITSMYSASRQLVALDPKIALTDSLLMVESR